MFKSRTRTGSRVRAASMAQWERTQRLGRELFRQVESVYSTTDFPLEIRHYFASWIEAQAWSSIDVENPAHEVFAVQIMSELITMINQKAEEELTDFLTRVKLQQMAQNFEEKLNRSPLGLVRVVKNCLEQETRLVSMDESMSPMMSQNDDQSNMEIIQHFETLKQNIKTTEDELQQMQLKQEKFVIDYQSHMKIRNQLQAAENQNTTSTPSQAYQRLKSQKEAMDQELLSAAQELLSRRLDLAQKHSTIVTDLQELQKSVVEGELLSWKRNQQLSGNGAPMDSTILHTLQKWCQDLAELVWKTRQQVVKVDMLRANLPIDVPANHQDLHPMLNPSITHLLSSLVTSTFIVETQPPQVLKREARFTATVRLLVGGGLNIHMSQPEVKASIINEHQARALLQSSDQAKDKCCGTILNNTGKMEYHSQTGELSVTFRNMQLKKIVRSDKKGAEVHTVAEEKFCLLFQSDFNIGGNEMIFQVWTLSLPVVVTVHGNQECNAMATVLWDNQFSEPGRIPFQVPDAVKWPDIAKTLSVKFKAATGRGLSQQNLEYLASKVFLSQKEYTNCMMHWYQFNKESMQTRNFTFWEWFYAVLKLTREHLKGPWCKGHIIGFIDKANSQDMLMNRPNGTFLLRFSESEIGGITIAWVMDDVNKPGERLVWNLAPFTARDFGIRSLADRIKDLHSLVLLYPSTSKDDAFSEYYSQVSETQTNISSDGYIRSQLINTIPAMMNNHPAAVMNYDNPQTPQGHAAPASPTSTYASSLSHQDSSAMDDESYGIFSTDYTPDEAAFDAINININEIIQSGSINL